MLQATSYKLQADEKGMALLATVLIILIIMVAVGLSMTASGVLNGSISDSHRESETAYFSAQAGAKDALLRLARNKNFINAGYLLPAGCALNGTTACANIVVESSQSACSQSIGANQDCLIATGTLNSKTRKIEALLDINATSSKITIASQKEI